MINYEKLITFCSWFTGLSILAFLVFILLPFPGPFALPGIIKIIWIVMFIPTFALTMYDDKQRKDRTIFESGYKAGKRDRSLDQEYEE